MREKNYGRTGPRDHMENSPEFWDAVFWDIGGVILDHDSTNTVHRRFVEALVEQQALDTAVVDALETWQQTVGDYFRKRDGTEFRLAEDAYHLGVESIVGEAVDKSAWRPLFDRAFDEYIEPQPNARSVLNSLAGRDIHVGIISDIDDREANRILTQFDIESMFDSVTTSEEVGRTKPDPRIFRAALEKVASPPERTLMIGDRYTHDMHGGANAGMNTIAFGAESGPAVDFRVDDLSEIIDIVEGNYDSTMVD